MFMTFAIMIINVETLHQLTIYARVYHTNRRVICDILFISTNSYIVHFKQRPCLMADANEYISVKVQASLPSHEDLFLGSA